MATALKPGKRFNTRTNLALAKRLFGRARIEKETNFSANTADMSVSSIKGEVNELQDTRSQSALTEGADQHFENENIWKVTIPKRWYSRIERIYRKVQSLIKLWRKMKGMDIPTSMMVSVLMAGRELTPIELAEIRDEQEQKRLNAFHRENAKRAELMIINALVNIRKARFTGEGGRERAIKKVSFSQVKFDAMSYRYCVNAVKSPINVSELMQDDVATHISATVGHPTTISLEREKGSNDVSGPWIVVEVGATLRIPNQCDFEDLIKRLPNSAPALAFVLGYSEGRHFVYKACEPLPHLLIAGETLGGKSNMMNTIICSHLSRNTPDELRTLMIDVKGAGIELGHYEGIKHMILDVEGVPNGIASNVDKGVAVLEWVTKESQRRMEEFTAEKIKNLDKWNRKFTKRTYPRIVVYMDELAELLDPEDMKVRKSTLRQIRTLAQTCRAAGVYLVVALQSADRTNVPMTIKNNFPGRIAFAMSDGPASMVMIGDYSAANLQPVGRAIWKHGTQKFMVQTPFISDSVIAQVVENSRQGKVTTTLRKSGVSPEDLILWSIEDNNGELDARSAFAKFNHVEQAGILKILKEMDGNVYVVGENDYQVLPGRGRLARIVVKVPRKPLSTDENIENATQNTNPEPVDELDDDDAELEEDQPTTEEE